MGLRVWSLCRLYLHCIPSHRSLQWAPENLLLVQISRPTWPKEKQNKKVKKEEKQIIKKRERIKRK